MKTILDDLDTTGHDTVTLAEFKVSAGWESNKETVSCHTFLFWEAMRKTIKKHWTQSKAPMIIYRLLFYRHQKFVRSIHKAFIPSTKALLELADIGK